MALTRWPENSGEACQKADWQLHAWCLMHNHFHFVLETPCANLIAGMQWFLGVYTNPFNHRHKEFGHLFSGRYKALMVDGSGNGYLKSESSRVWVGLPSNWGRGRRATPVGSRLARGCGARPR